MLIIPAILEENFALAKEKIKKLSPFFSRFQIDIADGKAVPNKTLGVKEFITEEFPELSFDFHLMVKSPEKELAALKEKRGVNLAFVNLEAAKEKFFKSSYPFEIGITLNPEDSPQAFAQKSFFEKTKHLLLMTVNPGFQGSPFLPKMLYKIKALKKLGFKGKIYLDGGINENTLQKILPYKNHIFALCIGSYLTKKSAEEIENAIHLLLDKI